MERSTLFAEPGSVINVTVNEDLIDEVYPQKPFFPGWKGCKPHNWVPKRLPILQWLPKYTLTFALYDLIAGITVGLTIIPQGIAYALLAKLPAQYGLYSAIMSSFVYLVFGTTPEMSNGPSAIMALITLHYSTKGLDYVILLTFLSGLVTLALGILKLGFVMDFISVPVISGFTSAAAITIALSQLAGLLGLTIKDKSDVVGITGTLIDIGQNADSIRVYDSTLGLVCSVTLLALKFINDKDWLNMKTSTFYKKMICTFLWVFTTARNAVLVIACTLLAYGLDREVLDINNGANTTFLLTGNIQTGLPPFRLPPFSHRGNQTEGGRLFCMLYSNGDSASEYVVTFDQMIAELGSAVIVVPLLAILENIAVAKSYAGSKVVDVSQEMIALGLCNVAGSFVQSMPTSGSISRSAVNASSDVKTQAGGIYSGTLVLLALAVLMPYCAYIPKASLAAVIITSVIYSVDYQIVMSIWRTKWVDLIPGFMSFFATLFWALEYGIMVGIAIQLLFLLYAIARPSIKVTSRWIGKTRILLLVPDSDLVFPAINYVRDVINKAGTEYGLSKWPVVLDCSHVARADFTAAQEFQSLLLDFKKHEQLLLFFKANRSVEATLKGLTQESIFVANDTELTAYIKNVCHSN